MKLSEIFDALATGELSGLNLVKEGEISPAKYKAVISSINVGLINLATRFRLRRESLVLRTRTDTRVYNLDFANTVSSGHPQAYIIDSNNEPFNHHLIEVLKVLDADGNDVLGDRLVKVMPNVLRTVEAEEAEYQLEFSAMLKQISTDIGDWFDPEDIEVELPYAYLTALLFFVASRHYTPVLSNADSNRGQVDMNYLQRFEAECAKLIADGIDADRDDEVNLFTSRGFI